MMIKYNKGIVTAVIAVLLTSLVAIPLFAAADDLTDANISYWVRDSLRVDPRIEAPNIRVSSEQGIVTLSGNVDNLAAKHYADLEAKKIKGVLGVINKIEVMPVWRSDSDIWHAVKRRILGSAAITSEDIRVAVKNGRVILSGEVPDWGEVQQAGLLASEVPGVKKLTNEMVSVWQVKRSDQAIKKDAVAALQRDVYLSGLPITVSINDGIVSLTGSVGSVFENDRAMRKVRWISNVKGVVSDLKITGWEDRGARKKKVWPSDEAMIRAIREELDQDPRVVTADISVRANLGIVTLDGSVSSYYQMRVAGQDANNVIGVGWVVNKLLVRGVARSDWLIRDDVAFDLNTDYALDGFQLKSRVNNGVVTLSGEVNNSFEQYHAEDVTAGVQGVRQVINRITVAAATRLKNNQALTNDIINALQWNWTTWPVRNDIKVSVDNGIATLKGNVDNWSELREADRVAFHTAGIWAVDNQLKVNGYDYQWNKWSDRNIPKQYDPYYNPDYIPYYYDYPYWWDNS